MATTATASIPKLDWNMPVELGTVAQLICAQKSEARGQPNIRPLSDTAYDDHHHSCHYRANFYQDGHMTYSAYVRICWIYHRTSEGYCWEASVTDIDGRLQKPARVRI